MTRKAGHIRFSSGGQVVTDFAITLCLVMTQPHVG